MKFKKPQKYPFFEGLSVGDVIEWGNAEDGRKIRVMGVYKEMKLSCKKMLNEDDKLVLRVERLK